MGQLYGGKEGKEHSVMRRKSRLSTAFGKNHKAIKPKKYTKNKTFKKQKNSSSGRPGTSSSCANQAPFRMEGKIGKGKELKLTGVDMAESMLVSICRESDGWWSQEVELQVSDLLTGGQKLSPVKSSLRSGDVKFTISGVTTPSQIHRLSIFSPYWLVNKTGYSLSYKISGTRGKEISDQSLGGLPVLTDAGTSGLLDGNLDGSSLQCIPNTGLFLDILNEFWGDSANGNCVSQKNLDLTSRDVPVKYSDKIGLDNVGQEGEIACGNLIFGVTVETLTGIFVESNLITFTPRFFARNKLARSIVLVALRGKKEVVTKAGAVQKLWLDGQFEETQVLVEPGENAVIYYFDDLHTGSGGGGGGINSVGAAKERFICFRTQQPTGGYSEKVHIVPADRLDTVHFSERSSTHTVDSIIVSKNTKSGASTVVTIEDSSCLPPFRIENRSADHSLLLVQEGENDAEPIFLEPLTWCNYAFDNPHGWRHSGTLRLKVAVVDTTSGYGVPGGNIRDSDLPRVTKMKGIKMSGLARGMQKMMSGSSSALQHRKGKSATGLLGGIEEVGSPASNSGLNSSAVSAKSAASASGSLMSSEYLSDSKVSAKVLNGSRAKSYSIDKVGRRKDLPCPKPSKKSEDENHGLQHQGHLVVEVGILRGTKVITFNDSMYKINQSKIGMIKSGGDWRNVEASVSLEGVIVNLIDNTPHEILNLTLKELVAIKQRGDITFTIRLRHLQVDNMLEGARYPLVLQPVTQGLVDDRTSQNLKSGSSEAAAGGEGPVYWEEHMEKPVPFFELSCSYIPLESMIWIPLMYVQLTPLKLQVDLGYILKLANVITSSIPDANTVITEDDIAVAYAPVERKFEVLDKARPEGGEAEGGAEGEDGGPEESSERYAFVERLYVSQTWLELELFLRSEKTGAEERALADKQLASERRKAAEASEVLDRARKSGGMWAKSTGEGDRSDSEDEEDETEGDLEALNSFGRTTSSSVSANLLTWLTNIAGSFAHISPTFSFANLDIPNHFGPLDVLFSHVGRHYLSKLLYQSYKLFSIHLLGDPFSLVNSITTGALNFITITRDELMAKGHKGFGGGVKSLVQGVVGGTSKSTSMALGGAADLLSEISGNGQAMTGYEIKGGSGGPKHVGDGLIQSGFFFGKSIMKGVGAVLENPARGMKRGPAGFAGGLASGVGGLVAAPFIATFGSAAILTKSIDATTHMFDEIKYESRCRPRRDFGEWGAVSEGVEVDFLKGVGVRVHSLVFSAIDKRAVSRAKGKKKVVIVGTDKKRFKAKGKVPVGAEPSDDGMVEFTAVFNSTIVIRSADLQLYDEFRVELWDKKMSAHKPLALTFLKASEIMTDMGTFHRLRMTKIKEGYSHRVNRTVFAHMSLGGGGEADGGVEGDGNAEAEEEEAKRLRERGVRRLESMDFLRKMRSVTSRRALGSAEDFDDDGAEEESRRAERRLSCEGGWRDNEALKSTLTSIAPAIREHILYIPMKEDSSVLRAMKDARRQVEDAGTKAMHAVEKAGRRTSLAGGLARGKNDKGKDKGKDKGRDDRKSTVEAEDEWFAAEGGAEDFLTKNEIVENGEVYGQLKLSFFPIEY